MSLARAILAVQLCDGTCLDTTLEKLVNRATASPKVDEVFALLKEGLGRHEAHDGFKEVVRGLDDLVKFALRHALDVDESFLRRKRDRLDRAEPGLLEFFDVAVRDAFISKLADRCRPLFLFDLSLILHL